MDFVKTSEVIDVRDGTHDSPKYIEKGYPLITSKNLKSGKISFEEVSFISKDDFDKINKRSKVDKGDILYSMIGSIGNYAFVDKEPCYAIKNVALFKFNNDKLFNKYFYFLLNSSFIENQISLQQKGGTQKFVTLKILRNLKIPLPPLATQKKIAAILDEADKLRQLNKQLIAKYDALTQSLFLEMFGDPVTNPRGWNETYLEKISNIITKGSSPKWQGFEYIDKGIRFVTSENVRLGYINCEKDKFVAEEFHNKLERSKLKENDLLVNLVGASIGRGALMSKQFLPANINQAVSRIELKKEKINPIFLLNQIITPQIQGRLIGNKVEGARANISLKNVRELKILFPPIQLQNQFAERVQIIEHQKQQAQEALQKSEDLFNSLLQKAFKGALVL